MPLRPSRTISDIGGLSLVMIGSPKAVASNSGRPRPSQREGARQTSQAAKRARCSSSGSSSSISSIRGSASAASRSSSSLRGTWALISSRRCSPSALPNALMTLRIGLRRPRKRAGEVEA